MITLTRSVFVKCNLYKTSHNKVLDNMGDILKNVWNFAFKCFHHHKHENINNYKTDICIHKCFITTVMSYRQNQETFLCCIIL